MKLIQENDFNDSGAINLTLHHGGSIDAQECFKQTNEPAPWRWLFQLPQPLSSALSFVLGPFHPSANRCWDKEHARK